MLGGRQRGTQSNPTPKPDRTPHPYFYRHHSVVSAISNRRGAIRITSNSSACTTNPFLIVTNKAFFHATSTLRYSPTYSPQLTTLHHSKSSNSDRYTSGTESLLTSTKHSKPPRFDRYTFELLKPSVVPTTHPPSRLAPQTPFSNVSPLCGERDRLP